MNFGGYFMNRKKRNNIAVKQQVIQKIASSV